MSGPPPGTGGWREDWQHFHPLSPILRGGVAFVAVVSYVVGRQFDRLFGANPEDPTAGHPLAALGVVAAVLVGILLVSWVSWRVSRFRVGPGVLELRTGLLFRQHRQVRYDRVQAVDLTRPLLARVVGLSEVTVQAAGGRSSGVRLAFLGDARARELRDQLVRLAGVADEAPLAPTRPRSSADEALAQQRAGRDGGSGWESGGWERDSGRERERGRGRDAGERDSWAGGVLVRIPNARLVQSSLYSGSALFLLLSVPVLAIALSTGIPGVVAWLGPTAIGIGGQHLRRLLRQANFELSERADSLRVRHGLTELRATSVPLHRVQAVELRQPLMWRLPGWWQVRVNVAGVHGREGDTETTVVPVGTLAEALGVLGLIRPGLPLAAATAAMTGQAGDGFVSASRRARWFDPLGWRRRGYAVTPDALVARSGALTRVAQVVPHARVQSLRLQQGAFQRSAGVATVVLVSTPGPVRPGVEHLDLPEATRLLNEQVLRSAAARAPRDGPGSP